MNTDVPDSAFQAEIFSKYICSVLQACPSKFNGSFPHDRERYPLPGGAYLTYTNEDHEMSPPETVYGMLSDNAFMKVGYCIQQWDDPGHPSVTALWLKAGEYTWGIPRDLHPHILAKCKELLGLSNDGSQRVVTEAQYKNRRVLTKHLLKLASLLRKCYYQTASVTTQSILKTGTTAQVLELLCETNKYLEPWKPSSVKLSLIGKGLFEMFGSVNIAKQELRLFTMRQHAYKTGHMHTKQKSSQDQLQSEQIHSSPADRRYLLLSPDVIANIMAAYVCALLNASPRMFHSNISTGWERYPLPGGAYLSYIHPQHSTRPESIYTMLTDIEGLQIVYCIGDVNSRFHPIDKHGDGATTLWLECADAQSQTTIHNITMCPCDDKTVPHMYEQSSKLIKSQKNLEVVKEHLLKLASLARKCGDETNKTLQSGSNQAVLELLLHGPTRHFVSDGYSDESPRHYRLSELGISMLETFGTINIEKHDLRLFSARAAQQPKQEKDVKKRSLHTQCPDAQTPCPDAQEMATKWDQVEIRPRFKRFKQER